LGIIKRAKLKIEMNWEEQLFDGKGSGPIFWLKNHAGYVDKQQSEISGPDGAPIEFSGLELANRIANILLKAKKAKRAKE
jgi:hypothetical protein